MSAPLCDIYDDQIAIPGIYQQLDLPINISEQQYSQPDIDINSYDVIIVCFSGGKDSIACLLRLLDLGVDRRKIELWHHDVDGAEGSHLMDWLFMHDYVRKFGEMMNIPIYFSWLEGGFEGEMLKQNSISKPHHFESPDGLITLGRERSRPGTRYRFPQMAASLQTRWCSSSLKIDVGRRALNNQERFEKSRVLFITGERREESPNRAKYNQLERHQCDRREGRKQRYVDSWRPVLDWDESEVWEIMRRYGILPPIPYRLGWSRSSCACCIFNHPRIWATIAKYFPDRTEIIASYEDLFGTTISRSQRNVLDIATAAKPFIIDDVEALEQATRATYDLPIVADQQMPWVLPAGAYRNEGCGST